MAFIYPQWCSRLHHGFPASNYTLVLYAVRSFEKVPVLLLRFPWKWPSWWFSWLSHTAFLSIRDRTIFCRCRRKYPGLSEMDGDITGWRSVGRWIIRSICAIAKSAHLSRPCGATGAGNPYFTFYSGTSNSVMSRFALASSDLSSFVSL